MNRRSHAPAPPAPPARKPFRIGRLLAGLAIAPIALRALEGRMKGQKGLDDWRITQSEKIVSGFYISQAVEARRS